MQQNMKIIRNVIQLLELSNDTKLFISECVYILF